MILDIDEQTNLQGSKNTVDTKYRYCNPTNSVKISITNII